MTNPPIRVKRDEADALMAEWEMRMGRLDTERKEHRSELEKCAEGFLGFLPYWSFVGREIGDVFQMKDCRSTHDASAMKVNPQVMPLTPDGPKEITDGTEEAEAEPHDHLWEGQVNFAKLTETEDWIYALKAGKLGFTELECAFDAWRLLFGPRNARVHIFSRADTAAIELLEYVRFGITKLPDWMRPPFAEEERGGDTGHSLMLVFGEEDKRRCVAYAAGPKVSIDQTCHHAHVDELAVMPFAEKTWNSISSTVSPHGGTCHVVTRGAGDEVYAAELWDLSKERIAKLFPFFQAWDKRPDRDAAWREKEAGNMTAVELKHYAPETEEDALAGDSEEHFVPIELWDRCKEELPYLEPATDELGVLGVDAGVRNDYFAVVFVTRHPDPDRHEDIALRKTKLWTPPRGGEINFAGPEAFIWAVCLGGCVMGHWKGNPWVEETYDHPQLCPACVECVSGREAWLKPWNIYEVAYDPHQMENTAQRGRRDAINFQPFEQGKPRFIADSELRDLIATKRMAHDGEEVMRNQVEYAGAKLSDEDHKIRIVKLGPQKKVDLVVALSMASKRCMELYL